MPKVNIRSSKSDSLLVGGNRASTKLYNKLKCRLEQKGKCVFITLTYDQSDYENPLELYRVTREDRHVRRFKERLQKYLGENLNGKWARKMEFTKSGWLHYHMILETNKFIPHTDLLQLWGHGHVWINQLKTQHIRYFTKYVAKQFESLPSYLLGERPRSIKIVAVSPTFWGEESKGSNDRNVIKSIKWCVFAPLANTLKPKTEIRFNDTSKVISSDVYSVIRDLSKNGGYVVGTDNEWIALLSTRSTLDSYLNRMTRSYGEEAADAASPLLDNGGKCAETSQRFANSPRNFNSPSSDRHEKWVTEFLIGTDVVL